MQELGKECHIGQLLRVAGHAELASKASALYGQLLKPVARQLEHATKLCLEGKVESMDEFSAHFHEGTDEIRTPRDIDVLLLRHVESSKALIGRPLFLSVGSDGAWVKGLKLLNTLIVTPDNYGYCCPPQVVC